MDKMQHDEKRFKLLFENMMNGFSYHKMIYDSEGNAQDYVFLDVNDAFEKQTGLKRENIIGRNVLEVLPGTENYWIEIFGRVALTGVSEQFENYYKELNRWYEVNIYSPKEGYFAVISNDITERKLSEEAICRSEEKLRTTLLSIGDAFISTDKYGKIELINIVAESLTGWSWQDAKGRDFEDVFNIINEHTRQKCENPVKKVLETGEIVELASNTILISKDGTERSIEDSAAPIKDRNGITYGVVLVFRDFSEKKHAIDKIRDLSYRDQLTGLYNRRFYEDEIKRLNTIDNLPISVIMGDVNGLKLVNDAFGHEKGDEFLKKAASAILKACRKGDVVARWGGDEFVILLPETKKEEAQKVVDEIKNKYSNEHVNSINVSISFGLDTKEYENEDILKVLKSAEDNMYKNKTLESESIRGKFINAIINTLHEKNPREGQHSKRVSRLCFEIGEAMNFPEIELNKLKIAGLVHDIGKIAIEECILNKPGNFTDNERNEISRHPEIGYRILNSSNEMQELADYILAHHEKWDGSGYPKGLEGESIPKISRIIAIADSYDVMISERPYKKVLSRDESILLIKKGSGAHFDPEIAQIFVEKVLKMPWDDTESK